MGPSGEPVTGGEFQAGSLAASASYAVQIAAPTSLGATLKFLSQDLDGVRGSAVAADAGMIYRSPLPALTMGAQLANLGTRVNAATLPVVLKLGAGMSLPAVRGLASLAGKKGMWDLPLLAADVHFQLVPQKPRFITVFLGSEYTIGIDARQTAMARLGYRYGEEGAGGLAGAAAGFGYRLALPRFSFGLDYALVHYGELGLTHRFAVTTGFAPLSEVSLGGVEALRKAAKKEGQIYLTWAPAAEPQLTGYNVYMGETKDAEFAKVNREGPVSGTSLAIRGLTVGRTYHFFITPVTGSDPAVEGRPFFETSVAAQPVP